MRQIDSALLSEAFALESMAGYAPSIDQNPMQALGQYSRETTNKLHALAEVYRAHTLESVGHISDELLVKEYYAATTKGYERAAKEYALGNKFASLPTELKRMLNPLRNQYVAIESELAALGSDTTSAKARGLKWKKEQAAAALESMIFQALANMDKASMVGIGTESYTYQNAIYYPKLEAMVQWVNSAATIYSKVMKVKQLLNLVTSIPVHTQVVEVAFFKADGSIDKVMTREELYSKFKHENFDAYPVMEREMVLEKANFNKTIDLRVDKLFSGEPFLKTQEYVRTDFDIEDIKVNGSESLGTVYDPKAGKMKSEVYNELDFKGKVVEIPAEGYDTDKKKVYNLGILFDPNAQTLKVIYTKATDVTKEIESIKFKFKLHDVTMVQRARQEFRLRTERGMINAGAFARLDVPLNQSELDVLDQRTQGNFLNKITNLCSENIAHAKDNRFYEGYFAMSKAVKAAWEKEKKFNLYTEQLVDMGLENSVYKQGDINAYLGSVFQHMTQVYNTGANTSKDAHLNIFCHSLCLNVINPALTHIAGEVTEASNGRFLGVQQDARINVLSLGHEASTPVSSIVVGTDKDDLMSKAVPGATAGQVEHNFYIAPTFAETNLETVLFVETPTRVISDNAIRSPRTPYIPTMIMDYSAKVQTLRAAAGKLTIKGHLINIV